MASLSHDPSSPDSSPLGAITRKPRRERNNGKNFLAPPVANESSSESEQDESPNNRISARSQARAARMARSRSRRNKVEQKSKSAPSSPAVKTRLDDKIDEVNETIDQVKASIMKDIDIIVNNDQKITTIDYKAEDLREASTQFKKGAKTVQRRYWWKNCQLNILLAAVTVLVVLLTLYAFDLLPGFEDDPEAVDNGDYSSTQRVGEYDGAPQSSDGQVNGGYVNAPDDVSTSAQ